MSSALERWNRLSLDAAADEILPCCGSRGWAEALSKKRPLQSEDSLLAASDEVWNGLPAEDWMEAFRSHPRIGDAKAPAEATRQSATWSGEEQRQIADASGAAKRAIAEGNRWYESKFHRTFIVCATGKSPEDILSILQRRIRNDEVTELRDRVRGILLREWDPAGVSEFSDAQDEYDNYVPDVVSLVERRASEAEIFDCLWSLETGHMGLAGDEPATRTAARKIRSLIA